MGKFIDLSGQRFGNMVAKNRVDSKYGTTVWLMVCDCGKEIEVKTTAFKRKHKPQLGCLECSIKRQKLHGMTNTKEFFAWRGILSRCTDVGSKFYRIYGGRGIGVCERWLKFNNFFEDMGYAPSKKHSIDRIDNNKGYSKENCRWATPKEQCRNFSRNHIVEYNGEKRCISEWAEIHGLTYQSLFYRIKRGWDLERAMTLPNKKIKK